MSTPFAFWGLGDLLIDILTDDGAETGLQLKGDCPSMSIKTDAEIKELLGHGRTNDGQVLASVVRAKPATMSFTLGQVDQDAFAMAFFGTNAAFTQAATPLVDSPVTTIEDRWVEIGKMRLSSVVVENTGGTVIYVLGTDYELNERLGMIMALSTGAITAGQVVNVSATVAAISGSKITGMTKSNIRARIVMDGNDLASGRDYKLVIHRARLASTGDMTIQGENFLEVKFDGTMETPTGQDGPFELTFLS